MNIGNNMYQSPYMVTQNQRYAPNNNGITWVQGVEGAKAYQLMPNANIMLLDSENDGIFYIKTSDNVGMCNLRVFKYEEITEQQKTQPVIDTSQFVTKAELEEALNKIRGGYKHEQTISTVKPKPKPVITE